MTVENIRINAMQSRPLSYSLPDDVDMVALANKGPRDSRTRTGAHSNGLQEDLGFYTHHPTMLSTTVSAVRVCGAPHNNNFRGGQPKRIGRALREFELMLSLCSNLHALPEGIVSLDILRGFLGFRIVPRGILPARDASVSFATDGPVPNHGLLCQAREAHAICVTVLITDTEGS